MGYGFWSFWSLLGVPKGVLNLLACWKGGLGDIKQSFGVNRIMEYGF